ncbi:reverse transcriptase, partial [Phytophthora megakarya]
PDADRYLSGDAEGGGISERIPDQATDRTGTKNIKTENRTDTKDIEPKTENLNCQTQIKLDPGEDFDANPPIYPAEGVDLRDPLAGRAATTTSQDAEDEDEIYYHESGDLSAEDLEGNLAVLPEIPISTTAKVSIKDLHVGDSGSATPEEIEKLRQQIVWKKQHLLIGKGNALPLAAKDVVCDIDVGNAKPIALRTRKVPPRFRIYQRLVDNALYGYLKIPRSSDAGNTTDVFQTGIADDPDRASVLGRRSYIDNIMIAVEAWDQMCQRVGYLGHRVSIEGLEANPKDLKSLTDLSFPGSLRSMQSFLGSLNYYSRFIEDYAIYVSVLYELREVEFPELEKRSDLRKVMDQNDPIARDNATPEHPLAGSLDERWIKPSSP